MDLLTFIMCWIVFAVIAGWRFYIWKNESKAGITLEDRNDTFGAKFFGVRMRTIDFVLLNFITGNFLFAYFCYDMSKRLKKRYPPGRDHGRSRHYRYRSHDVERQPAYGTV